MLLTEPEFVKPLKQKSSLNCSASAQNKKANGESSMSLSS